MAKTPDLHVPYVLPRGLLARALLIIVLPLIGVQVVSGIIFYDRHWANVSSHRANSLAGEIAMIIDVTRSGHDGDANVILRSARNMDIQVDFEPGGQLAVPDFQPRGFLERTLAKSLRQYVGRPFNIHADVPAKRLMVSVQLPGEVIHVTTNVKRLISSTTKIFILWMAGTSIVLFALATVFMTKQVSPIQRLARAADNFGKGRDAPDFKPAGAAEVRQAAAAFLAMRERIKRQIEQRTEMLAGVSHDLRTPLTRMKLQLAMLRDHPDIGDLAYDVQEMERMIDGYLDFARGEGGEEPQSTDVAAALDSAVKAACYNGNAQVELDADSGIEIPLRRDAFRRCITNLVGNALRFGSQVMVAGRRSGGTVEITVDDDGPGIPAAQRDEAFRPFIRLDQSRNLDHGGSGLGLAIARDIARSHGGELDLLDSPLGGLRARLRLPV